LVLSLFDSQPYKFKLLS